MGIHAGMDAKAMNAIAQPIYGTTITLLLSELRVHATETHPDITTTTAEELSGIIDFEKDKTKHTKELVQKKKQKLNGASKTKKKEVMAGVHERVETRHQRMVALMCQVGNDLIAQKAPNRTGLPPFEVEDGQITRSPLTVI